MGKGNRNRAIRREAVAVADQLGFSPRTLARAFRKGRMPIQPGGAATRHTPILSRFRRPR